MDAKTVRQIAQEAAMAVFGIGPASRLASEPAGHRPTDLLPGAASMVVFGMPVPQAVYKAPQYGIETTWRSQNLLYRRLDSLALRLSNRLAENGAQAVPVYGCMPLGLTPRGKVVGYVNQIKMAAAIGMGAIGKNGLLIHSHYASRLMLGGLVTTAKLQAIRWPAVDEPGCPRDCQLCIEVCPVDAIIPGKKRVKVMRCLRHTARNPLMSRPKFLLLRAFSRQRAARYLNITGVDEHTLHVCSRCVVGCPYPDPQVGRLAGGTPGEVKM